MLQDTHEFRKDSTERLSETEFLAAIVESSQDAIVGKTLDGVITSWNRGAEQMFGYAAAEAIGRPISLIIPAHRMAEVEHILECIRRGKRVDHYETARLAKTGQIIRVSLAVSPVRDHTGKVIAASAVARDISHVKKTEAALAESERRYHSLVETAIHGIFRCTLAGRFLEVNPALVRLLGYEDRRELLDLSIPANVFVDPAAHTALIAACMHDHKVRQDTLWKHKDGKHITVRLSAYIVFSDLQPTIEAIAEDVTAQLEFDKKLQQLERIELLGQLAGGIAHDFNNCLNIIMGHEALLSQAIGATEHLQRHLVEIRKAIEHAAQLTQRLLVLGKKDSGIPRKTINLHRVLQESQGMLKGILPSNVSLTLDLSSPARNVHIVTGDIQQIVVNLVLNARDAMPNGGEIRITTGEKTFAAPKKTIVGDYLSGTYTFMRVVDTGHGMDKATATRAIEPFFTTKPEGKGTGLGLASVYATVKRYCGSLDIETALRQGTEVSIFLPSAVGSQGTKSAMEQLCTMPRTVLIVDDNDEIRQIMAEVLSSAGFKTLQTASWKEARAAYEREDIDVVLCDLQLADISPPELIEELRWLLDKMRIIVTSGRELTEEEQHRLQSGVFLQKPFSATQLLASILGHGEAA
jgi:PAS domain S-box-containing protein